MLQVFLTCYVILAISFEAVDVVVVIAIDFVIGLFVLWGHVDLFTMFWQKGVIDLFIWGCWLQHILRRLPSTAFRQIFYQLGVKMWKP